MALLWEMFSTSAACLREMFFEVGWFLLDFLSPSHLIEMLQPPYGLEDILEIVMALLLLLVIGFFVAYTINGIHAVFVHRQIVKFVKERNPETGKVAEYKADEGTPYTTVMTESAAHAPDFRHGVNSAPYSPVNTRFLCEFMV